MTPAFILRMFMLAYVAGDDAGLQAVYDMAKEFFDE